MARRCVRHWFGSPLSGRRVTYRLSTMTGTSTITKGDSTFVSRLQASARPESCQKRAAAGVPVDIRQPHRQQRPGDGRQLAQDGARILDELRSQAEQKGGGDSGHVAGDAARDQGRQDRGREGVGQSVNQRSPSIVGHKFQLPSRNRWYNGGYVMYTWV